MSNLNSTTIHGVLMIIEKMGVLITGEPGSGKSSLALALISRGQQLVADDIVEVIRQDDCLIGHCPLSLQNFLKIRGVEIFNIRKIFGSSSTKLQQAIQLIINLTSKSENFDTIDCDYQKTSVLDIAVPTVKLSTHYPDLALLAETLVKNHLLKVQGYDASTHFLNQQTGQAQCA